ncbi:kinase-like domain-containing protein [Chlamydoabsidia padenii]|nr:kinase-like domain-containing protein [Chlamydoabsidia padenii]
MRVVGRGAFGKVRIVEHRESHQLYAMKYISKDECIRMDAARNVIRERMILEQLDHPFLCRLRFAFQDNLCMYMVTDLMLGGDLYYHISADQYFSEDVLRFWFAELSSAVKYLHFNGVVHRDIKPQNILMDEWGHVHLADFNIATYLQPNRLLTSGSGTSYYMAPEVYKGGGYNEAVDWWGLGVTLYECVYGKKPFEHETNDELSAAIRRGHVHYSNNKRSVSGECLAAIQGFLEMTPSKRLGQGDQGWVNLVQHPFFRSVDWRRLESKTLTPPFQPATNQNNFDPTFDLEQMVVEDFGGERQCKSTERTMILEKFKPFDFTIFEKYEGFKDPVKRTVGEPPDWVKPAFAGAERDLLPITRIEQDPLDTFEKKKEAAVIHGSLWRSASANNLASRAGFLVDTPADSTSSNMAERVRKRRSLGTYHSQKPSDDQQMPSLSEEYALSLQGVRKKQSTRSFRERRERDRKSVLQ